MKKFLWNEQENRLRAVWRLLLQLTVWNVFILLVMIPLAYFNEWPISFKGFLFDSPDWLRMVTLLVTVLLMARFIDIRHFSEFGLDIRDKEWWKDFVVGLLLGALTVTGIFAAQYALGWYEIEDTFFVPGHGRVLVTVGGAFLADISVAVYEILWFWSYSLRNMSEGMIYLNRINGRAAVIGGLVLTLIYFVLFQITRSTNVNTIFISNMFRAGLLLALPFILTQRLGLSIGLFMGWNLFQIHVYGFQVVGLTTQHPSLLVLVEKGPDAWTGGSGGV